MEKKETPKDYWSNYEYYKNKENKELVLDNILTLPDDIVITLYKYNKVYLDESLRNSLENRVKQNSLEVLKNKFDNFYYKDHIGKEFISYNETIKTKLTEPKYDLTYRSRNLELKLFENGFTRNIISDDKNNVIIMDFLLFNKNFSIRYDQVEWLFNYCRIRNLSKENITTSNFYCVDGWVYHSQSGYPEYKLYRDVQLLALMESSELVGYNFPNKLVNRNLSIQLYLLVASNCPDELLNWHNYLVILEWYQDNKEYFNANTFDEFYKINIKKKSFYSKDIINTIKTNFINNINVIPNYLIKWSGQFVENYLRNKENIDKKVKNAYNQRNQYDYTNDKVWEYMCGKELESSKNIYDQVNLNKLKYSSKQEYIKISSRFDNIDNFTNINDFGDEQEFNNNNSKKNNFFSNIFRKNKKNKILDNNKNKNNNVEDDKDRIIKEVSMIDFMVYNQFYNLSYEDIGWAIQYCKFEWIKSYTGETFNIDGWYFDRLYYSEPSKPNYIIEYRGLGIESVAKLQIESGDDEQKINILRFAIQLVNEAPDEYVNLHNYYLITQWYNDFDPLLQSSRMTKGSINYYLEELEKKNKITLEPDNLIVKIDSRLTKKELINKLYYYSEHGQSTNYNLLLKETKNFAQIDLTLWENLEFIGKILDAEINTKLNLSELDLTEFLESNGKINTINLINSIKSTIAYRFNVHNAITKPDGSLITKEELLAGMYNIGGPVGMGIFQASDKTISVKEAAKLLENNDYFDYLNGIRMKTGFEMFPIMNYERYDKSQGEGTFFQVIYNLVRGNQITKEKLTKEKIFEQLYKMTNNN
jgi:hypothetical protein